MTELEEKNLRFARIGAMIDFLNCTLKLMGVDDELKKENGAMRLINIVHDVPMGQIPRDDFEKLEGIVIEKAEKFLKKYYKQAK